MFKKLLKDRSGAYAIMMAVISVPLLLGVGLAVDYARLSQASSHLQELADGASLTLAASRETDKGKLRGMAESFVKANAAAKTFETVAVETLDLAKKDEVGVTLKGRVPMTFMSLANIKSMDVSSFARAVRGMSGAVEVALVLDNTDSMNKDNKIGTLKKASTSLVGELFKNKEAQIRVALVPYAEQINVGTKHRKAAWLSAPDDYVKTITNTVAAVPAKDGYWHQPTKNGACQEWKTIPARDVEQDGVWVTIPESKTCVKHEQIPNGPQVWVPPQPSQPARTTTSKVEHKWKGCVGMRVDTAQPRLVLNDQEPAIKYPGLMTFHDRPQRCLTEIVPLTADKAKVEAAVAGMITSRSGYIPETYIPNGLMWGINVLSPSEPFTEGAAYDASNTKPRKVIVLMTDGLNTRRPNLTGLLNTDFLKGKDDADNKDKKNDSMFIGGFASANAEQRLAVNDDTITLCNYAKAQKIEIFTVAFKVDSGPAKAMLEACATSAGHYYDAGDPEALLTAFADIAQSLVKVRLAQ
ncbi:MAG TPA: TadE/TadG family type IV pilus assembly protein [Mesorhizobium sp.]|jgi:Flp pilus assembly protein TadG|nr:TadE/TadG family type IV pilus assembly protein [Mesorhizobium sp.]